MRSRMLRLILACLALLTCAWFVLGARQAHDIAAAANAVTVHRSSAGLAHVRSLLDSAAFLYPGQEVQILRGRLAIVQGHSARAQRILATVVRAEPKNLEGWIWLTGAALGNPPLAHAGLARIYQLDPLVAGAHPSLRRRKRSSTR
jgi:predicted Zn-dependent protease